MANAIDWAKEHNRGLMAAFAALAVIVLIIGLCLSWFVHSKSLSTVGAIKDPAELKLMGPNETVMTEIDLTYDPQKDVDEQGNVTLKKPFCVKSDKQQIAYSLMLAHTTNINGLSIKLYRAEAKQNPSANDTTADVAGLDGGGNPFAWNKTEPEEDLLSRGSYINEGTDGKADSRYDDQTFGSYADLERSASPLYWKLSGQNTGADCLDNYIIELKWRETQKETDVLYLIALAQD